MWPWAWCQATLGALGFLASLQHPPSLSAPGPEERPGLGVCRGARFVVLELPAGEGEYRPGCYLCSVSPANLARRLEESLPGAIRERVAQDRLPPPAARAGHQLVASTGASCDACGGFIPPDSPLIVVAQRQGHVRFHEACFIVWRQGHGSSVEDA